MISRPNTRTPRPSAAMALAAFSILILGSALPNAAAETATPEPAEDVPYTQQVSGMAPVGGFGSYFRLRHYAGDGVGHDDSFTTFGLFQPVWQDDWLLFVDGQLILANDTEVGGNVGLGLRRYLPCSDRIVGLSLWYDVDDRHRDAYHQLTVGLESLGRLVDFRTNVYIPLGDTSNVFGDVGAGPDPIFSGWGILLGGSQLIETALTGLDMEFGTPIPGWLGQQGAKVYGGWYHYQGDDSEDFYGAMGRVEGHVAPNLNVQLTVSNDPVFDTSVVFGVCWVFPGGSACRGGAPCDVYGRMAQPVQRNQNVVVATTGSVGEATFATDPTTGLPITVVHVDSAAAGGGDGSVETPFQTLAEAQVGSGSGDIVFVHADSLFDGQQIFVQADQRLLGEGIDHYVDTVEEGTILMPRATAGTAVPVIRNAPTTAISCNRNVEVSGFTVEDPGSVGINASMGGNMTITRNTVSGTPAGLDGIYVAGTNPGEVFDAQIHDNVVSNSGASGIYVGADCASFNVGLSNNTVSNCSGLAGISFVAAQCDGTIDISGNTSNNNNSGSGWAGGMHIQTDGNLTGTIANNTTNGNELDGIAVVAGYLAASDIDLDITGNTANNNGQCGITISQDAGTMTATVSGNTLQDNESGLYVSAANAAASLDVLSNTISGSTAGRGMAVFAPQLNGTISGNTIENNATEGCILGTTLGGTGGDVTFSSNYLSGNNSGSTEFWATHAGSGTFTLRMGDNTSTNTPPPANYQLFNTGTGTFNFIDEGGNVGTFSGP